MSSVELLEARKAMDAAWQIVQGYEVVNVYGKSPDEIAELGILTDQARERFRAAYSQYQRLLAASVAVK